MPRAVHPLRRTVANALLTVAALGAGLAGCVPYARTDGPTPRRAPGVLDALGALVTDCDDPRPDDPVDDPRQSVPGDERRTSGRCTTPEDRGDAAPTPSPQGPTQRRP